MRAVVVLDYPAAESKMPELVPSLVSDDEKAAAQRAMSAALKASEGKDLCEELHGSTGMKEDVRMAWSKLRECVSVGRQYRYSDMQLAYHYTKEKALLVEALHQHRVARRPPWLLSLLEVLCTLVLIKARRGRVGLGVIFLHAHRKAVERWRVVDVDDGDADRAGVGQAGVVGDGEAHVRRPR